MTINFRDLKFEVTNDKIELRSFGNIDCGEDSGFAEIQIAGENKQTHMGMKPTCSSEGKRLTYVNHVIDGDKLTIVQKSELVGVKTVFEYLTNATVFRAHTEVTNVSDEDIVLEDVSALLFPYLGKCDDTEGLYYTKFVQGHHTECQPYRASFDELGFFSNTRQPAQQKRIAFTNVGSWSTKEELPQGVIEDTKNGTVLMFQIECNATWYYEISDRRGKLYLYATGASSPFGGWYKKLAKGESYRTPSVALALSHSVCGVLGEMTKYRRAISGLSGVDYSLPTIFNEYMHLSWDSPTEENTKIMAPIVAGTGVEYYVIDCGWHNEEPGNIIYPYVGQWKQSNARFPNGVRATTDYIRSLGMKAGLWIEPEIVGIKCTDMLEHYDDDCFLKRYGKRIANHDRYFLDYRNPKVIAYMTETIRRMVEDYGADYIKFDYNQDMGVGTDEGGIACGEGLELCAEAFLNWVDSVKRMFPKVVFEGCASGGMRMDYKTLSYFSLISTSDQIDYLKYPYIAGNILSAVIPEQAAVWSYPVGACTKEEINDDQIIMNMINSFLGRMHLASHLELMNEHQLSLVREGVEYYKTFSDVKHTALPFLPLGFTRFGDKKVAAGFKSGSKVWLAVWCLSDETVIDIDMGEKIETARLAYPYAPNADFTAVGSSLHITFERPRTAAFFEIELG